MASAIEVCAQCYGAQEITRFGQAQTCGMCGGRGWVSGTTPPGTTAHPPSESPRGQAHCMHGREMLRHFNRCHVCNPYVDVKDIGYPLAAGGFDFTLTIETYEDEDIGPGRHVRVWIHHPNEDFDWNGTVIGTFQDLEHAARQCNGLFPNIVPAFVDSDPPR